MSTALCDSRIQEGSEEIYSEVLRQHKSTESKRCSKKVEATREELMEMRVYYYINDESDNA
jgi:hypothetical protein